MMKTNTNFEKDHGFVWPLRDVSFGDRLNDGKSGFIEGWRDVSAGPFPITDRFGI